MAKLQYSNIGFEELKRVLIATAEKRGSVNALDNYQNIMKAVKDSAIMQKQWRDYQRKFEYASDIMFDDVCDTVVQIMEQIGV